MIFKSWFKDRIFILDESNQTILYGKSNKRIQ